MSLTKRVTVLEKDLGRIKYIVIYIAAIISVKFGGEIIPGVMAMLG